MKPIAHVELVRFYCLQNQVFDAGTILGTFCNFDFVDRVFVRMWWRNKIQAATIPGLSSGGNHNAVLCTPQASQRHSTTLPQNQQRGTSLMYTGFIGLLYANKGTSSRIVRFVWWLKKKLSCVLDLDRWTSIGFK